MRRRTVQPRALPPQAPPLVPRPDAPQALAVPGFLPQHDPIPASLARWTGNLLYWATSMGAQYYGHVTAPLGLTPAQIAVLQVLAGEGRLRQARLTDRTRIDKASMVGLLNELETQGLIERHAAPHDKRAFDIYLTAQGEARVQEVEAVSQAAEDEFYGVLSAQERETLRTLLTRLMTRTAAAAEDERMSP